MRHFFRSNEKQNQAFPIKEAEFSLFAPPELIDAEAPLVLDPLNAKQVVFVQLIFRSNEKQLESPTQPYYIYSI